MERRKEKQKLFDLYIEILNWPDIDRHKAIQALNTIRKLIEYFDDWDLRDSSGNK